MNGGMDYICIHYYMDDLMARWMEGWINECMYGWKGGYINKCMYGWMDGCMDG